MFDLSKLPKDFSVTIKIDGNAMVKLGLVLFVALTFAVAVGTWIAKKA